MTDYRFKTTAFPFASSSTVDANLTQVMGTAIPAESVAGNDAAALGKLLDVASPVLTAASVNQTADVGTRVPQVITMAQVGGAGAYYVEVLDNSGAAVAPASTALSSGTWTGTKAGYLDAAITSRSSHAAADVAALILATPANKLVTNASGYVTFSNTTIAATVSDKTGFTLAADGLDSITATEPVGKPTTFRGWLMWLVQCFRAGTMTATTKLVKTEAGATVTTQTVSDDGTTETLGPPT